MRGYCHSRRNPIQIAILIAIGFGGLCWKPELMADVTDRDAELKIEGCVLEGWTHQLEAAVSNGRMTRKIAKAISGRPGICKVVMRNVHAGQAEDLLPLSECEELELVAFVNCAVSGDAIAAISSFSHMTNLTIHECEIEGDVKWDFSSCPKLGSCRIGSSPVGDDFCAALRGSAEIKNVWLSDCPVTDRGAESLCTCRNLKDVNLNGTKITDRAIVAFRGLKLDSLLLANTAVTDASAHAFAKFPLDTLHLDETACTEETLAALRDVESIRSLSFQGIRVGMGGLRNIAQMKGLQRVHLSADLLPRLAAKEKREIAALLDARGGGIQYFDVLD